MTVSSINVINVNTKLHENAVSKHIKCVYVKKSSMTVINVNIKVYKKAISKHTCLVNIFDGDKIPIVIFVPELQQIIRIFRYSNS